MITCWSRRRPQPPRRSRLAVMGGVLLVAAGVVLLSGCAVPPPPPFRPISWDGVRVVHCVDGVPHQPGSSPWVLGGTCCCTPTPELLERHHQDRICTGMSVDDLIALYHEKAIVLPVDHTQCNNLCAEGPHVTQGGRCMVAPTPGTRQFEEVVTGRTYARRAPATQPAVVAGK